MNSSKTPGLGRGFSFGIGAYLIWGSFPLIISLLGSFASADEIVGWRIVFGFVMAIILLTVTKTWQTILPVIRDRKSLVWMLVSTVTIMTNWWVYVIGVATGHIIESSLGYFINPLVTISLAVFFLKERLRVLQWVAVALGAIAVTILTVDYGHLPVIALALAVSFGIYGLAKKKVGSTVSPLTGYAIESGFLTPIAIVQLSLISAAAPGLQFNEHGIWGAVGLSLFGFITAIPLIMFGSAAKFLPLSYVGLLQYLTPVLQFVTGLFIFHEAMSPARWVGFGVVWLGLALFTFDMLSHSKSRKSEYSSR
jgi:chloramphenicol-sensitive protein RarD